MQFSSSAALISFGVVELEYVKAWAGCNAHSLIQAVQLAYIKQYWEVAWGILFASWLKNYLENLVRNWDILINYQ